jgi:CheY-like chemotaxis protein
MSKKSMKVLLLVEDNPGDARLLREMLNEQNSHPTELTHVERLSAAEAHLAKHAVDVILLDLGLPDAQGLGAVRRTHEAAPHVPLVVLTGLDDETLAAQALQEGAQDYLIKGQIDARGLLRSLCYAIERKSMEEALLVEKERAQVTLNCIGDAVVSTQPTDRGPDLV